MRPLVLISNDDGIDAPAVEPLCRALEAQDFEIFVVAPERQRSAASHQITLHKPLRVVERAPNRFATSGTPADCVYMGLLKMVPRQPSLVVSGINEGYNLGGDVFYSGTVAAAVEGGLRGVPGLAVSMAPAAGDLAERAAGFAASLARSVVDEPLPQRTVLNINVPDAAGGSYRWTCLGERVYSDDVDVREDPRGRTYYWIGGGAAGHRPVSGSDCEAVHEGVISVTPLFLDLTCRRTLGGAPPWRADGFDLVS